MDGVGGSCPTLIYNTKAKRREHTYYTGTGVGFGEWCACCGLLLPRAPLGASRTGTVCWRAGGERDLAAEGCSPSLERGDTGFSASCLGAGGDFDFAATGELDALGPRVELAAEWVGDSTAVEEDAVGAGDFVWDFDLLFFFRFRRPCSELPSLGFS